MLPTSLPVTWGLTFRWVGAKADKEIAVTHHVRSSFRYCCMSSVWIVLFGAIQHVSPVLAQDVEILHARPMELPGDGASEFLEGPSFGGGALYYSQRLGKGAERKAHVRRLELDATHKGAASISSYATNGTWYHGESLTAVCRFDDGTSGVIRFSLGGEGPLGKPTILVKGSIDGRQLVAPNDLARDPLGGFYFTDKKGKAIYYLAADGKASLVTAYVDDGDRKNDAPDEMDNPNGIIISPDGRSLYVTDNSNILHAPIAKPGKLAAKLKHLLSGAGIVEKTYHEIAEIKPLPGPRGRTRFQGRFGGNMHLEGMTVDAEGVVYGAALSTGMVFGWNGKTGELVRIVKCPGAAINCTFGGKGRRTLFVVGGGGISAVSVRSRAELE
jgi:gluconolactonase